MCALKIELKMCLVQCNKYDCLGTISVQQCIGIVYKIVKYMGVVQALSMALQSHFQVAN